MSDAIDALRKLLQRRLQEIEEEIGRLNRAGAHLVDVGSNGGRRPQAKRPAGAKSGPRSTSRKPGGKRRRKGGRVRRGERREQLIAVLEAKPGSANSEVAKQLGISPSQASTLLRKASDDKLVVKKGEGYALKAKPKRS